MKTLKNAGAFAIVLLAGVGGFYFFSSSELEKEVEKHGERIGEVEEKAQKQQGRIAVNEDAIEVLKREVAEARQGIVDVQGQLKGTQSRLGAAEADLKKVTAGARKNDEQVADLTRRVEKLSFDQANLAGELERRALKVQVLGERLKIHAIEIDRRLRILEDKAELKPPIP